MSESATNKMEGLRTGGEQTPSELDWQVYRLIRVEQWPLSNVGQALGISEARVGQIVDHVGAHMVATAPILSKDERERQLGASKQLAAERIDFLYGEALRCFRSSQGTEKIVRQSQGQSGCTTTRENRGDARYLQAAARLAILASKLPSPQRSQSLTNPTKEDCSAVPPEQPTAAAKEIAAGTTTVAAMLSCVEQSRTETTSEKSVARSVQTVAANSEARPLSPRQTARRAEFFQPG